MKSIKQQYIDLREGRMSQSNFLRSVRMSLPQYVTNLNNFDSTIKILKNKGILNENDIYGVAGNPEEEAEMKSMDLKNYNVDTEQLKQGTEVEMEHTNDPKVAERIAMDHIKEDPEYYIKLKSIGLEEANPGIDPTQEKDYKPQTSSKSDYEVVNSDGEVALLKDKNGDQFIFYYSDNKKEIEPYSSDGYDIDDMAIQHYINDNSYGLSKGVGMVDYEAGKDLVKVDDNLKDNFADLFSTNENQEDLSPKMKHIQKSMGDMDKKPTTAERRAELEKLIAAKKTKQQVNESMKGRFFKDDNYYTYDHLLPKGTGDDISPIQFKTMMDAAKSDLDILKSKGKKMNPFRGHGLKSEHFNHEVNYIIDNFLVEQAITIYFAPPKQGKSRYSLGLTKYLYENTDKIIQYFDFDNPLSALKERGA